MEQIFKRHDLPDILRDYIVDGVEIPLSERFKSIQNGAIIITFNPFLNTGGSRSS